MGDVCHGSKLPGDILARHKHYDTHAIDAPTSMSKIVRDVAEVASVIRGDGIIGDSYGPLRKSLLGLWEV